MELPIIYQDDYLLLVNKPAGIAVQNDGKQASLLQILKHPFEPVHRLDQRVSGLLLLAKTAEIQTALNKAFQERHINKQYKAVVAQQPPAAEAVLEHWLRKKGEQQKAQIFKQPVAHAKQAKLHYHLIQSTNRYHLLDVQLHTGLFHQIRAQLAAIGCPIVGDLKYGFPRSSPDGSIFLQAYQLSFTHPITQAQMAFSIPIPEIWKKYGFSDDTMINDRMSE
jgi:23S rRNA pseudouridine1911/1915/1917 synthase